MREEKKLLLGLVFLNIGVLLLNVPKLICNFWAYDTSDFITGFFHGMGAVITMIGLVFAGFIFGKKLEQKMK